MHADTQPHGDHAVVYPEASWRRGCEPVMPGVEAVEKVAK